MGSKISLPKKSESEEKDNSWIPIETAMCRNCHFVKKHFKHLLNRVDGSDHGADSAEVARLKKKIMQQQQHWEPCVKALTYMGHYLSKIIPFYPQRCSNCGNLIYGVCEKVYLCQSCGILCHSTCVEHITKSCKEIQTLLKDMHDGLQVEGHLFEETTCKFKRCVKCKNLVISFFDKCLQCRDCKAILHESCISLLKKNCPSLYVSQGYKVLNDESSLLSQNFKCPDCNTSIFEEFKDCHYCYFSKKFFCLKCHSNKEAIIPENVLQKWCFCPHPVSDWSKLFLNYMKDYSLIATEDISEEVMTFNGEIFDIMSLLEEIKNYYDYLPECQKEFDDILQQMRVNWPNLLKRPSTFSISNLKNIFESFEEINPKLNSLYPQLIKCHEKIIQHVRNDCQKCIRYAQKCMACEYKGALTTTENAIFYFDRTVISCKNKKCTPLNCIHRNCLLNNPFFLCKGCDSQMLKDEEFSLANIKVPVEEHANATEGTRSCVSKTEEVDISGMTCHGFSIEITDISP